MPCKQLLGLKQIIEHFLRLVGALVVLKEVLFLSITMKLIESTHIKVFGPPLYQARLIAVQARGWQEYKHVENHGYEDERTDQMRPDIDCLVVDHEERARSITIRMKANSVTCF